MADGVEVRGRKLRVYFRYNGKLCREVLPLEPTEDNQAYARHMVAQIRHEIRAGTFSYARYFPDSSALEERRLAYFLDAWLSIKKQRVAYSTYRGYAGMVERYIRPKWGDHLVEQIDRLSVERWISEELARLSSKTIRDVVHTLGQIFDLYRTRHPGAPDPTEGVDIPQADDGNPDPFTRREIDAILGTAPAQGRHQELNLVQFMVWAGPRVSEAMALCWEDVDLERGIVRFQRARVRGRFKVTKTRRSRREHELLRPALEALRAQEKMTRDAKPQDVEVVQRDNRTVRHERLQFVFHNSRTGLPHYDDHRIRSRFFVTHLRRAGVRYRGPGQCRHTYISQMLTAGMPLEWISKQVGTSPEMIRKRYGRWIEEDAGEMTALAERQLGLR